MISIDTITQFATNLSNEAMDINRNLRDLVGGTIAMAVIDATPLEGAIETATNLIPVPDNNKPTVAAGMTYACARILCRSGEKTLGF
jgi:hypothetical protein